MKGERVVVLRADSSSLKDRFPMGTVSPNQTKGCKFFSNENGRCISMNREFDVDTISGKTMCSTSAQLVDRECGVVVPQTMSSSLTKRGA